MERGGFGGPYETGVDGARHRKQLKVVASPNADNVLIDKQTAVREVKAGLGERLDVFDFDELSQTGIVIGFELAHAHSEGRSVLKLDVFGVPPFDA